MSFQLESNETSDKFVIGLFNQVYQLMFDPVSLVQVLLMGPWLFAPGSDRQLSEDNGPCYPGGPWLRDQDQDGP